MPWAGNWIWEESVIFWKANDLVLDAFDKKGGDDEEDFLSFDICWYERLFGWIVPATSLTKTELPWKRDVFEGSQK